ncbi:MAG: hypothetical protein PWR08_497 [Thermoanaerobacterium sp.]|nr:hypothetical protein [Thermoanaerobacterium sp.]
MISEYEKKEAINHADDIASLLINTNNGSLFYKVISNFVEKSCPTNRLEIKHPNNSKEMEYNLAELIKYMVSVAAEKNPPKMYTTGQLAKYFGVSITTINNWINENRFIGVKRNTINEKIKISENTKWRSPNGELMSVREIVDLWKQNNIRRNVSPQEEISEVENVIKYFESKYGGTYEKIFENKVDLNDEEQRDKEEWKYLLKRKLK